MIDRITKNSRCVRCSTILGDRLSTIDDGIEICQCGAFYTAQPETEVSVHVARLARQLTMEWAAKPAFAQPPWPWTVEQPPQVATGAPSRER